MPTPRRQSEALKGKDPTTGQFDNAGLWQSTFTTAAANVPAFEAALEPHCLAISSFEVDQDGTTWIIEAVSQGEPDRAAMDSALSVMAEALEVEKPEIDHDPLQDQDWVTMALGHLPAVHVGRFYVYGSHDRGTEPHGAWAFEIDASQAFGTGQHETTAECLRAIDWLGKARSNVARRPQKGLDVGCGTGVLAMAMSAMWKIPSLATDIDPIAVEITDGNVQKNGWSKLVTALQADALDHPVVEKEGPFDVIAANILAGPLVRIAPDIAKALAPGGSVILSGLLATQENQVLSAYRQQGLFLKKRFGSHWRALVLERRA